MKGILLGLLVGACCVTAGAQVGGNNKTFTVGDVTFNMVYVQAGTFTMGATPEQRWPDSDEKPLREVTICQDYYMGETEVTQALWKAVTGCSPTKSDRLTWDSDCGLGDDIPAYYISYADVQDFIGKLNSLTGQKFRMPTEAEWEYAARGGKQGKGYEYSGANGIKGVAWYEHNCYTPQKVKELAPNELGLYDMSGNVWEWCSDWFGKYQEKPVTNPVGPALGTARVIRGGSCYNSEGALRVANRSQLPSGRYCFVGVRLALGVGEK